MTDMELQEQDYDWFLTNYENLFEEYGVSYLAIKNKQVLGKYASLNDAIEETDKTERTGSYIVQYCNGKKNGLMISGAITGGITDPQSSRAVSHAVRYYAEIRKNHADVKKIAENTGFTYDQIMLVKNYLFMDVHDLDDGVHQFDESFEIAESWQRLSFDPKNIQPHDLTLINHELMEMRLVNEGLTQDEAHIITSRKYNYSGESSAYYEAMQIKLERTEGKISGAITTLGRNTH